MAVYFLHVSDKANSKCMHTFTPPTRQLRLKTILFADMLQEAECIAEDVVLRVASSQQTQVKAVLQCFCNALFGNV